MATGDCVVISASSESISGDSPRIEGYRKSCGKDKEELYCLINKDELEFLDVPGRYLCSGCGAVPIFHYIFECDHPYCRRCCSIFLKEKRQCRKCAVKVSGKIGQDKYFELAVAGLLAKCPNSEIGCKEEFPLKNLLEHVKNKCDFRKERLHPVLYDDRQERSASDITCQLKLLNSKLEMMMGCETETIKKIDSMSEKLNSIVERHTKESKEQHLELETVQAELAKVVQSQMKIIDKLTEIVDGRGKSSLRTQAKGGNSIIQLTPFSCTDFVMDKIVGTKRSVLTERNSTVVKQINTICKTCHLEISGFQYFCLTCRDITVCINCLKLHQCSHHVLRIPASCPRKFQGQVLRLLIRIDFSEPKLSCTGCRCHSTEHDHLFLCLLCYRYSHNEIAERSNQHESHFMLRSPNGDAKSNFMEAHRTVSELEGKRYGSKLGL